MGVTIISSFTFPFRFSVLLSGLRSRPRQEHDSSPCCSGRPRARQLQHMKAFGYAIDDGERRFVRDRRAVKRSGVRATGEREAERLLTWPLNIGGNLGWRVTASTSSRPTISSTSTDITRTRPRLTTSDPAEHDHQRAWCRIRVLRRYHTSRPTARGNGRVGWKAWGLDGAEEPRSTYASTASTCRRTSTGTRSTELHLIAPGSAADNPRSRPRNTSSACSITRKVHGVPSSGIRFAELGMTRGS